jgi:hypothetical protein
MQAFPVQVRCAGGISHLGAPEMAAPWCFRPRRFTLRASGVASTIYCQRAKERPTLGRANALRPWRLRGHVRLAHPVGRPCRGAGRRVLNPTAGLCGGVAGRRTGADADRFQPGADRGDAPADGWCDRHPTLGFYGHRFGYTVQIDLEHAAGSACVKSVQIGVKMALTQRVMEIGKDLA